MHSIGSRFIFVTELRVVIGFGINSSTGSFTGLKSIFVDGFSCFVCTRFNFILSIPTGKSVLFTLCLNYCNHWTIQSCFVRAGFKITCIFIHAGFQNYFCYWTVPSSLSIFVA